MMEEELPATSETEDRHKSLFAWSAVLTAGWLIYELTAMPELGAFLICAKFGWSDFRAATWLKGFDPVQKRGWACFWLYLSSSLWKMAILATLGICAFGLLHPIFDFFQPNGNVRPLPRWFIGVGVAAFVGYAFSAVTTFVSVWIAWKHGIKLWLSIFIDRARREGIWPPYQLYLGEPNNAAGLLTSAIISGYLGTVISLAVILILLGYHSTAIVSLLVILVLTPRSVVRLRDVLGVNILASSPAECWGTLQTVSDELQYLAALDQHLEAQRMLEHPPTARQRQYLTLLIELANGFRKLQFFDKALVCFREATRLSPRAEIPSLGLFHCLWDKGERGKAIAEASRFLSVADSEYYREILADDRSSRHDA
jgi:hypothetical protein